MADMKYSYGVQFQSTLSVRRATRWILGHALAVGISIHALRKESDDHHKHKQKHRTHFNPRSP